MRKIIFSSLLVSSVSFSFYKFEPYVIKGKIENNPILQLKTHISTLMNENTIVPAPVQDRVERNLEKTTTSGKDLDFYQITDLDIPVLFEPITSSYLITEAKNFNVFYSRYYDRVREIRKNNEDPIYDFFKCKFHYNFQEFWNLNNLVSYESLTSGKRTGPIMYFQNEDKTLPFNQTIDHILRKIYDLYERDIPGYRTYYSPEVVIRAHAYEGEEGDHSFEDIRQLEYNKTKKSKLTTVRLKKKIILLNETIYVVNEKDGVTLYKKEGEDVLAKINLKEALLNYYRPEAIHTQFAHKLSQDLKENPTNPRLGKDTAVFMATKPFYPNIKTEAYNLLCKSKIHAVWHVQPEQFNPKKELIQEEKEKSYYFKRPVYQVIIGLAHNDQDGYFHWATDLGRDIEVLFPIQSAFSKKSIDQTAQIEPEIENNKRKREEESTNENTKKSRNDLSTRIN